MLRREFMAGLTAAGGLTVGACGGEQLIATQHAGNTHAEEDLQPEKGVAAAEHASGQAAGPLPWGPFLSPQPEDPAAHPHATEAQQPAH